MSSTVAQKTTFSLATYIDGRWAETDGDEGREVTAPASGEVLARGALSSAGQISAAIQAATNAFDTRHRLAWSNADRARLLREYADLLEQHDEELANILTGEIGAPVKQAKAIHVTAAIDCIRWFADRAILGPLGGWERPLGLHTAGGIMSSSLIVNEPVGPVAALIAYNYPLLLMARKLGAIIASGCTAVLMPSIQAPLAVIRAIELLDQLKPPAGVINLVIGEADAGHQLGTDSRISLVSFTGSEAVGSAIMRQGAPGLKKLVLELGGKSPNIILPGANIDDLVGPAMMRFSLMAGQGCGATTRILVDRKDYAYFADAAQRVFASMRVGDPTDPQTDVGPLISAAHRDRVAGFVSRAIQEGGTVAAHASIDSQLDGITANYFEPQLIGTVDNSSEIAQEELFGPVAVLIPYDDLDHAVEIANGTRFALNANIWGRTSDALRLARRLHSGTVTVNGGGGMRQDVGWGGPGASGIGREAGEQGLGAYLEEKHIQWPVDGSITISTGSN